VQAGVTGGLGTGSPRRRRTQNGGPCGGVAIPDLWVGGVNAPIVPYTGPHKPVPVGVGLEEVGQRFKARLRAARSHSQRGGPPQLLVSARLGRTARGEYRVGFARRALGVFDHLRVKYPRQGREEEEPVTALADGHLVVREGASARLAVELLTDLRARPRAGEIDRPCRRGQVEPSKDRHQADNSVDTSHPHPSCEKKISLRSAARPPRVHCVEELGAASARNKTPPLRYGFKERLRPPQVCRSKPFAEPAAGLLQHLSSFIFLTTALPQPAQAHHRPQLPRLRPLLSGKVEGPQEALLWGRIGESGNRGIGEGSFVSGSPRLRFSVSQQQLPVQPIQLGLIETSATLMRGTERFGQNAEPFFGLSSFPIAFGQQSQQMWPEEL